MQLLFRIFGFYARKPSAPTFTVKQSNVSAIRIQKKWDWFDTIELLAVPIVVVFGICSTCVFESIMAIGIFEAFATVFLLCLVIAALCRHRHRRVVLEMGKDKLVIRAKSDMLIYLFCFCLRRYIQSHKTEYFFILKSVVVEEQQH